MEEAQVLADYPVFPILLATDLDASRTFYRDTLGLELIREDADGVAGPRYPRGTRGPAGTRGAHRGIRRPGPEDNRRDRGHGSLVGGLVPRPEQKRSRRGRTEG